jgi:hydrophobic/amphiphilic exporter-1 (mainly G- bacteria), HAE1 family
VLLRFDPANDPVMRLYLTGGSTADAASADLYQLRYLAEEVLKKDLESTDGVAAIQVNGGYEEEIQVRIDEGKLSLLGLSMAEVNDKLLRENVNQAGGSLYESEARYLVRARNEFQDLDDIRDTVIVAKDGRNVTLGDVAEVRRGHRQREVVTRFGGREAVELALYKEGDANAVSVARALQERLERVREELPEGVEVVAGVDQSRFIRASIDEVLGNALLGGVIAVVVLLFFLKDVRTTLIVGVSIPISIVATFFLMYRTGTTLNIMSLGGLALGVGMLVDNAIVVLEAIFRRRERGEAPVEAARAGASEVGMAVVASTLTTVAVFLPVVFLEGIAAQLFRDQALTVSFSLIASLAVSLTLIPMMSALAGRGEREAAADARPSEPMGRLRRALRAVLVSAPRFLLRWARIALGGLFRGLSWLARPLPRLRRRAVVALPGLPAAARLGPRQPGGGGGGDAPGLRRCAVDGAAPGVRPHPGVLPGRARFQRRAAGGHASGSHRPVPRRRAVRAGGRPPGGELREHRRRRRPVAGVHRHRGREHRPHPGADGRGDHGRGRGGRGRAPAPAAGGRRARLLRAERPTLLHLPHADRGGGLRRRPRRGARRGGADRAAPRRSIPGLVDVRSSAQLGNPELQVTFDREQLARLGLDVTQVAEIVRSKVQGDVATRFLEGDREIDVLVRSVEPARLGGRPGGPDRRPARRRADLPEGSVATVQAAEGPSEIRRIGQKRAAVVSGNLSGRDMAAVAADVRRALVGWPLPGGVAAALSGQEEEMQRSMRSLPWPWAWRSSWSTW